MQPGYTEKQDVRTASSAQNRNKHRNKEYVKESLVPC